jgi:tetratricopeptide (TPR) repeat protein
MSELKNDLASAAKLFRAGDSNQAELICNEILSNNENDASALHLLGVIYIQRRKFEAGEQLIARATLANPRDPFARNSRGVALHHLQRFEDAAASFDRALALKPDYAEAMFNRGIALRSLKRPAAALASFDQAVAVQPNYAAAHFGRAKALKDLGRPTEAVAGYERALALNPNDIAALSGRGSALYDLGRLDESVAAYDRVLELKPDDALALSRRGIVRLALGDLPGAWSDYEHRLGSSVPTTDAAQIKAPRWSGEDLAGKSILVLAEQGFGDTIHFCRYLPMLKARGAEVTLFAPRRLLRLLQPMAGHARLAWQVAKDAHFDYQSALLSLPRGFETSLESLPAAVPYLAAEPEREARWREAVASEGFKIGVSWQGDPTVKADAGRSAPLAALLPIAQVPGVRLISLQKTHGLDQLADLPTGMMVETLGEDFDAGEDAFIDTAAVMQSLDLVVSVDTAVGHLAGALGRPTFLALKQGSDWRWMSGRSDSPWYPATRLYRQARRGDWADVFEAMAADIRSGALNNVQSSNA